MVGDTIQSRIALTMLGVVALLVACAPAKPTPTLPLAAAPTQVTRTPTAPSPLSTPTPSPTAPVARPQYGGTAKTYIRNEPVRFDPHAVGTVVETRQVDTMVFSGLAAYRWPNECEQELEAVAAESWRWIDNVTLEVRLRSGVRFHNKPPVNGRLMTARDVVYSFQRLQRSDARAAQYMRNLSTIETGGDSTVLFRFSGPAARFILDVLASPFGSFILPQEAGLPSAGRPAGRFSGEDFGEPLLSYVGSGPFMLQGHVPGVRIEFERFPGYFKGGLPYLDRVIYYVMPDWSTRVAAFRSGKLDLLHEVVPPVSDDIRKTVTGATLKLCPRVEGLASLYMRTDLPPFNDVRVRRAVSMAIDRQAIIKSVMLGQGNYEGIGDKGQTYALGFTQYPAEVRQYLEYQPEEAKRLLSEAGYPQGLDVELWSTLAYGPPRNEMFEAVISQLQNVGIRPRVTWQERVLHSGTVAEGKYPAMALTTSAWFGPYEAFARAHSKYPFFSNRSHVADPSLDALIEGFERATDEKRAADLAAQIQIRVAEQAYEIRLPANVIGIAFHPWVNNAGGWGNIAYLGMLWENVWLRR